MAQPAQHVWRIALCGFTALHAIVFLAICSRSLAVRRDIQYPESAVISGVIRVQNHEPLYSDYRHEPFAIVQYMPLYYEIAGRVSRWTTDRHQVFIASRSLTLTSSFVLALLLFLLSRTFASRAAAITATLLFLGSGLLIPWGYMARVDMLAIVLAMAGIAVTMNAGRGASFGAPLFFVASFLVKQTMVAAPVATGIYLWLSGKRAGALKLILVWLGGLVLAGAACASLYGPNFRLNVVDAALVAIRWKSIGTIAIKTLPALLTPLVLAIYGGGGTQEKWLGARRPEQERLFRLYLMVALVQALLASVRAGSDINYYLEVLVAASICSAPAIDRLDHRSGYGKLVLALATGGLVIAGFAILNKYRHSELLTPQNDKVIQLVERTPGEILVQDANVLLQTGRTADITDSYHLSLLEEAGRWSNQPLMEKIRQRRYSLIVLSYEVGNALRPDWSQYQGYELWSRAIQNEILANYSQSEVLDGWHVYRPLDR